MRSFGNLAVHACAVLTLAMLACGGDDSAAGLRRAPGGTDAPATGGDPAAAAASSKAATACAALPQATALSLEKDIRDVSVVDNTVFFQSNGKVQSIQIDGANLKDVYTGPNVVRSFVDHNAMIIIEANDTTNATIRILKSTADGTAALPAFPGEGGNAAGTDYNAAGTHVFATSDTFAYLIADTNDGDAIVMVSKDDPNNRAVLATGSISSPQIVDNEIWFVMDQNHVNKVAIPGGEAPQAPAAEVYAAAFPSCSLAVDKNGSFCSVGSGIERRDLAGQNPTMIIDAQKSVTTAAFGAVIASDDGQVIVRSDTPDPTVKNVIRTVDSNGQEKLVICGRGAVVDLNATKGMVVWSEQDGGLFSAPR